MSTFIQGYHMMLPKGASNPRSSLIPASMGRKLGRQRTFCFCQTATILRDLVVRDGGDAKRFCVSGERVEGVKLVEWLASSILERPAHAHLHQTWRERVSRQCNRLRPAKVDRAIHLQQVIDRLPPFGGRR